MDFFFFFKSFQINGIVTYRKLEFENIYPKHIFLFQCLDPRSPFFIYTQIPKNFCNPCPVRFFCSMDFTCPVILGVQQATKGLKLRVKILSEGLIVILDFRMTYFSYWFDDDTLCTDVFASVASAAILCFFLVCLWISERFYILPQEIVKCRLKKDRRKFYM